MSEIITIRLFTFAAIVAAIVACIHAIRARRLNKEIQLTHETARRLNDEIQLTVETVSFAPTPAEQAISQAWWDIQAIKEVISNVILSTSLSRLHRDRNVAEGAVPYDIDVAETRFKPAYKTLVDGYAQWSTQVPQPAREAWHNANFMAFATASTLFTSRQRVNDLLTIETIQRLKEVRLSMIDAQMVLEDSRQTLRYARLSHFFIRRSLNPQVNT